MVRIKNSIVLINDLQLPYFLSMIMLKLIILSVVRIPDA